MKKLSSLMFLALAFLVLSCRNELDSMQENTPKFTQTQKSISSKLISINTVRKEVKSFSKFQSSLNNSKAGKTSFDINSNNILYRKFENATTGITTYTLPINSYSSQKPYYLIQQILISPSNVETTRYLKIIPNNPPAYKTEDVLKNLTGSIEVYDEDMSYVSATNYLNGVAQNLSSQNKPGQNVSNKTSGECDVDIITTEVLCSNGNGHHVGQTCDPGMTNDAHFEVTIVVSCPHEFGPATIGNPGSNGSGSLSGGYVFDEQLNALLTNSTFLYGDYLTSPGHELLLQIVRQWIPANVTDINGDLSELNTRLQHFSNNDQMFNDLATYNQNTPNVPNAEVTDYSIRVYELFKFLLDNPSPENGQIASWAVSFFDQNRFVSWEDFRNTHILNAGFISYINTLPMNLKQVINNQSNQEFLFGLNTYYTSQAGSQQAKNFITWALQFKAVNTNTTWATFKPMLTFAHNFLQENPDTLNPEQIFQRLKDLDNALTQNPNFLINIPCSQLPDWEELANHPIPQSVINKIFQVNDNTGWFSSAVIQNLDYSKSFTVNMDVYPVKITNMPEKSPGVKYTHAEFFDYFRKNINNFTDINHGNFYPVVEPQYGIDDTQLWYSNNPVGSLITIKIPADNGTVVCSGFNSQAWIFTTVKSPWDGEHPVSGNRLFGYFVDAAGNMIIYTRGVDRFTTKVSNNALQYTVENFGYSEAKTMWQNMQQKVSTFVNNKNGNSSIIPGVDYTPSYIFIKDYLKGIKPLTALGCH